MASDDLASQMVEKTTEQLQAMFEQSEDWRPEALDLAATELQRRGCPAPIPKRKPEVLRCRGAYTLQGIGTTFYGQRDFRRDGTYITTEWIVFFFFPILPIRSLRLRYVGPGDPPTFGFGSSESYSVYEKSFPNWKQVLWTYGYVGGMVAWMYFVGSVFSTAITTGGTLAVTLVFIACIIPVPIPWILRHYAMRKLRA